MNLTVSNFQPIYSHHTYTKDQGPTTVLEGLCHPNDLRLGGFRKIHHEEGGFLNVEPFFCGNWADFSQICLGLEYGSESRVPICLNGEIL